MQKALSELICLTEAERSRLFEREPLLVTENGKPHFIAQSLEAFEAMVRRLRALEELSNKPPSRRGKLILLRNTSQR